MTTRSSGARRWAAASLTGWLLLTGAACSPNPQPTPESTPSTVTSTPSARATAEPGPRETPTTTVPPPASTPVPQRSPGDVNSTVPTTPAKTQRPVPLDKTSGAGDGVSARLTSVRAVTAEAKGPGEVTGPALAVTVAVTNGSSSALDLDQVAVTLDGSDSSPGNPMTDQPAQPITGRLAAGGSASGVYVFAIAKNLRKPVVIQVMLSGGAPILVFTGNAA